MKVIYTFDEGNKSLKNLLGGKGANLAEMKKIGLNIPSGFVISTQACLDFLKNDEVLSEYLVYKMKKQVKKLEVETNKKFGHPIQPLFVSVRSGAAISMPGMMDTILNLGMNDETVVALATSTMNQDFAYESYKRFIKMYSEIVLGIDQKLFESLEKENHVETIKAYKQFVFNRTNRVFPEDPYDQLVEAVEAVFRSWNNSRAKTYRELNGISHDLGTAVTVQEMVFGNLNEQSGTGICFSRNPSTGENNLYGEFLLNAQGEDIVAGLKTPIFIDELKHQLPDVYDELKQTATLLENHYKDLQDIEFTIEDGKLFILQTRIGKRTAQAAVKIAVDLVEEQVISKEVALTRIDTSIVEQLLHPRFNEASLKKFEPIGKGLGASVGAASGKICLTNEEVVRRKEMGEHTILVRKETSPEDIQGMIHANGILTITGGMTSHAAVIARGMGKCCVVGCEDLSLIEGTIKVGNQTLNEGDMISIDGNTGKVYLGNIEKELPMLDDYFKKVLLWADQVKRIEVHANCDTEEDAERALEFGARGIGLCRTEHMFFNENRIDHMRRLILSRNEETRKGILDTLYEFQYEDFLGILKVMQGFPVTIRLLDPPLHEFLPHDEEEMLELSKRLNVDVKSLSHDVQALKEFNPMLGHRGSRLAVTYPDIYMMQVKAIIQAGIDLTNQGYVVYPEIMVPLIGSRHELEYLKNLINNQIDKMLSVVDTNFEYRVGTMIEIPRAAITSDEIAKHADFFSFGTNDLTQMTYGFSRDDSNKFINEYIDKQLLPNNPFMTIDEEGVGKLIEISTNLAKIGNGKIKIGICGEHGGDPASIDFFNRIGLEYVSCSSYRVPVAKLAAAKSELKKLGY